MSDKRTQLENAAIDSVQRSGFNNLSFRSIASDVGIKSSSVHYYFPEKSDLAAALIEKYSVDFSDKLRAIGNRNISPKSKLDAFVKLFEDAIDDEKFCLCGMMAAEVYSLNSSNRQALLDYFQFMEDWVTSILEGDNVSAFGTMKPRVLARMLVSGLEGAILIDRVDGRRDRLKSQREFIRELTKA